MTTTTYKVKTSTPNALQTQTDGSIKVVDAASTPSFTVVKKSADNSPTTNMTVDTTNVYQSTPGITIGNSSTTSSILGPLTPYQYAPDASANLTMSDNKTSISVGSPTSSYIEIDGQKYVYNSSFLTDMGINPVADTAAAVTTSTSVTPAIKGNDHALDKVHSTSNNLNKGRLTNFSYQPTAHGTTAGATSDPQMAYRCYMSLGGQTGQLKSISEQYSGTAEILNNLAGKYTAFILSSLQLNFQEKQQIMPTIGDEYAATFAGHDPQILAITGFLPWGYEIDDLNGSTTNPIGTRSGNWLIDMLNAYTLYFRASVLARAKCWLTIVLPSLKSFRCYPVAFNASINAENDHLVPFTLQAYVQDDTTVIYGLPKASLTAAEKATAQIQAKTNSTPDETGAVTNAASKKSDLTKALTDVTDYVNKKLVGTYTDWTKSTSGKNVTTILTAANTLSQTSGLSATSKITALATALRSMTGKRDKVSSK